MIDTLNEEISKFLTSFLNTEDEKLSLIEKKCSSTITDDLESIQEIKHYNASTFTFQQISFQFKSDAGVYSAYPKFFASLITSSKFLFFFSIEDKI